MQQVVQPAVRGAILDARGVPLADNETRLVVSASRTELMKMKDDGVGVLTRLADVLDMKPKDVLDKVRLCDAKTPQPCWNGSPYQPIPVTDEATTQQALQIRERAEDFPGITAEPTAVRRYAAPGKANTAQVLGYLSPVTDEEITKAQDTDSPLPPLRPGRPLGPGAHVRQGPARQGRRHPLRGRQPRPRHRPGQERRGRARLQRRHLHRRPRPGRRRVRAQRGDGDGPQGDGPQHQRATTRPTPAPSSSWRPRPAASSRWPPCRRTTPTPGSAGSPPRTTRSSPARSPTSRC